MTKDKNGITLVSLVITVIVMLIIFGVTITSGTVLLDNSRKTKIETSLYEAKSIAEALLEQYMFDKNIELLISFSKLEQSNKNPTGYNKDLSIFKYKKRVANFEKTFQLEGSESFKSNLKKIFPKNYNNKNYLYVKWGWYECLSQGMYKTNSSGEIDSDSIVDKDNAYIIVENNLQTGVVNVAYSKGYKINGITAYTLDSILNIDTVGEN